MERLIILSLNRPDWPKIQKLLLASTATVEKDKLDRQEWQVTVVGCTGELRTLKENIENLAPQTICSQIKAFDRLFFCWEVALEDLYPELEGLSRIAQKELTIRRGHLSENGWHIEVDGDSLDLVNIQSYLAAKNIQATLL